MDNPKTKSVFINQLDGGYTLNLQGNNFYPVKSRVTVEEVCQIITDFFNTAESVPTNAPETSVGEQETAADLLGQ